MAKIIESAYVNLVESKRYVFARIQAVGNCFVVKFIANNATIEPVKSPTHCVYVGDAFESLLHGIIVVKDGTLMEGADDAEENGWILPAEAFGNNQLRMDL